MEVLYCNFVVAVVALDWMMNDTILTVALKMKCDEI